MAVLSEVSWSDLLNKPTPTVERLEADRHRALRIRRRDGEDLVLITASRASQEHELVEITRRLLFAVMRDPALRSHHLVDLLPAVFPWVRFLPQDDLVLFLEELIAVFDASVELGNPAPALTVIAQWRNTAEVWADPELRSVLSGEVVDAGPVPAPKAD